MCWLFRMASIPRFATVAVEAPMNLPCLLPKASGSAWQFQDVLSGLQLLEPLFNVSLQCEAACVVFPFARARFVVPWMQGRNCPCAGIRTMSICRSVFFIPSMH
jgi:hypothetical protein